MSRRILAMGLVSAIAFITIDQSWGQAPDTLWTRTYHNYPPFEGYCIRQVPDGGFAISGIGYNPITGMGAAYLIKIDSFGDSLWAQSSSAINGAAYNCMAVSPDGIIVAVGRFHAIMGGRQSWGQAFSNGGTFLWSLNMNRSDGDNEARWVERTPDGGYAVSDNPGNLENPHSDLKVTKFDSIGNQIWSRSYGGPEDEIAGAVRADLRGGYIVAGSTDSYGAGNFAGYLVRIDSIGDTLWTGTYGGSGRRNLERRCQQRRGIMLRLEPPRHLERAARIYLWLRPVPRGI